jgi:TonB family protein
MGVVRLRSSLSVSIAIHMALVLVWIAVLEKRPADVPKNITFLEIEQEPKNPRDDRANRRIVKTTPGEKVDVPAPNAFFGKRTQVVDRETVGERQNTFGAESNRKTQRFRQERLAEKMEKRELSRLGVAIIPDDKKVAHMQETDDRPWQVGETLSQEYVKGLKKSDRTALNTKEYVFYGYFERIRQRLDLAWTRALRDQLGKLYRGGRRLASDIDHTTRLLVTLDTGGDIIRVQVIEESGTRDLDDAAIKAFNKAGPFPNPPKGIVDAQGRVEIRWDFVLKT